MKGKSVLLFLIFVIVALTLLGETFPKGGINLGDLHLRFPSMHSLVEYGKANNHSTAKTDSSALHLEQLKDSVAYYRTLVDSGDLRFWLPDPHYLDSFWQTVETAREQGRTVRILHYGDSQVEMDHMTSRLRTYMQETFGGGGPGMLPFQTITPTLSVRQSNNGDLVHLASFGDSLTVRSRGDYGPMMQSFRLDGDDATVTIKAATNSHVDSRVKQFSHIKLISNTHGGLSVTFTDLKNKKNGQKHSTARDGINKIEFCADSTTTAFRLHVNGTADLYCMLVDDSSGIAVDNIPMRGCSGQQFTHVSQRMLAAAYENMDIGMIILQFGGNTVPYLKKADAISSYCTSIAKQIDHLHACCPNAKILFIGPSDMSHRAKGEIQTYDIIPQLIDSLAATATSHGAAYWSIYHAMGGWNTMPQWAKQGLAGKDYIHFSQKGADQMGNNLSQAFNNSYMLYLLERRWDKQVSNSKTPQNDNREGGSR